MITCRLALVAEGLIVDAQSRNLTAYNIMDEVQAVAFPAFINSVSFGAILERDVAKDPETIECRFRLTVNGDQVLDAPVTLGFEDKARTRMTLGINGALLSKPGSLHFRLVHDGKDIATYEVAVVGPPPRVAK